MGIIKYPVITEKATAMHEEGVYTFVVDTNANKIQVAKAVEERFNVKVDRVNTSIQLGKNKTRYTKAGVVSGKKTDIKRALVKLAAGEDPIDLYAGIE